MASPPLRVCVDRAAPLELALELPDSRLAALRAKMWPAHQRVLHIRFLGGDLRVHNRIERIAAQWMQYANVRFVFDNAPDAVIRIGFEQGASWCYIGVDALDPSIGLNDPTMNFGW